MSELKERLICTSTASPIHIVVEFSLFVQSLMTLTALCLTPAFDLLYYLHLWNELNFVIVLVSFFKQAYLYPDFV